MKYLYYLSFPLILILSCKETDSLDDLTHEDTLIRRIEVVTNKGANNEQSFVYLFHYDNQQRLITVNNETFSYNAKDQVESSTIDFGENKKVVYTYNWDNQNRIEEIEMNKESMPFGIELSSRKYEYNQSNNNVPGTIFVDVFKNQDKERTDRYYYDLQEDGFVLLYYYNDLPHSDRFGTYNTFISITLSQNFNPLYPVFSQLGFMPVTLATFGLICSENYTDSTFQSPFFNDFISESHITFAEHNRIRKKYLTSFNSSKYPIRSEIDIEGKTIGKSKHEILFFYE